MTAIQGAETAWSCTVQIQGQMFPARFWYDGQYVNSAREDAAQVALQRMGQLPGPAGSTPNANVPQQHPQHPPPGPQASPQQPGSPPGRQPQQHRYYGVIGS